MAAYDAQAAWESWRGHLTRHGYRPTDPRLRAYHEQLDGLAKTHNDGSVVLDLGAGEGPLRVYFPADHYVTFDNARGDETWDYSSLDVIGDSAALPFRDASVDLITSTDVLEHLARPLEAMREAWRVLRPGGTLYLTVPFYFHIHQEPQDYCRYTVYGVESLLTRAGFVDPAITPNSSYAHSLAFTAQHAFGHLATLLQGPPERMAQLQQVSAMLDRLLVLTESSPQESEFAQTVALGYYCLASKTGERSPGPRYDDKAAALRAIRFA